MSQNNIDNKENILEKIRPYIKKGESITLGEKLKYKEKTYMKIYLNKGILATIKKQENEVLFIDESFKFIDKEPILKELLKLSHYEKIFFNENNKISIFKAIQDEAQMIKDERDYNEVAIVLKFLKNEMKAKGKYKDLFENGMEEILKIIDEVPKLRKDNNEKLKELLIAVKDMKEKGVIFSDQVLNDIYPIYKEALVMNFKKVKVIAKGKEYYHMLKKLAEKKRRIFALTLRWRQYIGNLIKMNYVMGYFEKVVNTYDKLLYMNEGDYIRFLKDMENSNVQNKIKNVRTNK
ncbi:hypothetical protein ACER0A_003690 [Haloimpatiens sp. FM7315]|uniref:hypothetical protein n=1 Tax=Haloimpatiens sp. FM7315 TaxID=3298609 RepID=UPI00370A18F1